MIKKISKKDKEDWLKFIKGKEKVFIKDKELSSKNNKSSIRTIDLHGYNLEDANKIIKIFIEKCYLNRINEINIITGKGSRSNTENNPYKSKNMSILKYSVPDYINSDKELMKMIKKIDFEDVNNSYKGSFAIFLKKSNI